MEYVYAAMVLHEADEEIDEESVTAVLEAAGVEVERSRVAALVAALEDIDIDEAVQGAGAVPVGAPAAAEGTPAEAEEAEESDEAAEEVAEEADDEDEEEEPSGEGLGDLFG